MWARTITRISRGRGNTPTKPIGALAKAYDTATFYDTSAVDSAQSRVYRGTLYAFEGYAELWLADFFCSGVPLSTLDYGQDFTYRAGSTTAQLYQAAIGQVRYSAERGADALADSGAEFSPGGAWARVAGSRAIRFGGGGGAGGPSGVPVHGGVQ